MILDSDITLTSSEESPCSTPLPTPLPSSLPSKNMQPIQSHATNLRIVTINFQVYVLRKKNFGASLMLPSLMSSLVVKHGLIQTLATVKYFHLAIMSTEKIELMSMEVCFWASQPALTAIKLKVILWLLECWALSMPLSLLPPITHLGMTKPSRTVST